MATLGERVRTERQALGLSQHQLAEMVTAAGFEIGQSGISNIEQRGDTRPQCIYQLALALGVTVEWLQSGTSPKHTNDGNEAVAQLEFPSLAEPIMPRKQGREGIKGAQNSSFPPTDLLSGVGRSSRVPILPKDLPIMDIRPIWRPRTRERRTGADLASEAFLGRVIGFAYRLPVFANRPDVFCARVLEGRMSPWREEGDLIHLDDQRPPRKNSYVLLVFHQKQNVDEQPFWPVLLAQLVGASPTTLSIRQFKPPREFDVERSDIERIYRVVDLPELLSQRGKAGR